MKTYIISAFVPRAGNSNFFYSSSDKPEGRFDIGILQTGDDACLKTRRGMDDKVIEWEELDEEGYHVKPFSSNNGGLLTALIKKIENGDLSQFPMHLQNLSSIQIRVMDSEDVGMDPEKFSSTLAHRLASTKDHHALKIEFPLAEEGKPRVVNMTRTIAVTQGFGARVPT